MTRWMESLQQLERKLQREHAAELQRLHERDAARDMLSQLCARRAVEGVLERQRKADRAAAERAENVRQLAAARADAAALEDVADSIGLFARAVYIFSTCPAHVQKFCGAWLDMLAAEPRV